LTPSSVQTVKKNVKINWATMRPRKRRWKHRQTKSWVHWRR